MPIARCKKWNMKQSKKAEALLEVFRDLVVFVILAFVGYKIAAGLIRWYTDTPSDSTKKSLEGFSAEVSALVDERGPFPIYLDNSHVLKAFRRSDKKPNECIPPLKNF